MPLATVADVRAAVPSLADATAYPDAQVTRLILAAQRAMERHCLPDHRDGFDAFDYDKRFRGNDGHTIALTPRPLVSVTTVSFGTTSVEVLDPATYTVDLTAGLIWLGTGQTAYPARYAPYGWNNVRVVYRAGYESGTAPADLVQALYEAISDMAFRLDTGASGIRSESLGEHSYTLADPTSATGLSNAVRMMLSPYRVTRLIIF